MSRTRPSRRPRCKHCDQPLRNATKNHGRRQLGAAILGLGVLLGATARSWAAFGLVAAVSAMVAWPKKPQWVCEHCGIVFSHDSVRDTMKARD